MIDESESADRTRLWIERLASGDDQACTDLINHNAARLAALTRRMFKDFARLGRWEQTDDICQNASLRLWKALKVTRSTTPAEFHRLAALQIRRELIDQVRCHFGPEGIGANHNSDARQDSSGSTPPDADKVSESTYDPVKLSICAEFHERVDRLTDDERSAFDLIWYQGLTQAEAAEVLGISERTLKRRWLAARLSLGHALGGEPPS